jgi:ribose transport system permease protein
MAKAKSEPLSRPSFFSSALLVQVFIFLLTAAVWVLLTIFSPYFFTGHNILNIMRQVSIVGIIAFGELFTIIIAGIDLSVGSVAALAGILMARLYTLGVPFWLAIFAGVAAGVVIGIINGFSVYRLGIPAFIITLAGLEAFRGVALLISGGLSIADLPPSFSAFGPGVTLGIPNLFWVTIIIGIIALFVLRKTRTGRYLYALGSNLEAARRAGINVGLVTYVAYGLSTAFAAIGGILLVSRLAVAAPTAAMGYELSAIAAAVVGGASLFGGRGSIPGAFIGALLFVTIGNGANLLGINPFWEMVAEGLLIAGVVFVDNLQKRRYAGS